MPDPVLIVFKVLLHLTFRITVNLVIIVSLLQMRKLKYRKVKQLAHRHTADKLQIWNSNLGCLYQESMFLTAMLSIPPVPPKHGDMKYSTFRHNTVKDMTSCDIIFHTIM